MAIYYKFYKNINAERHQDSVKDININENEKLDSTYINKLENSKIFGWDKKLVDKLENHGIYFKLNKSIYREY